MRDRTGRLVDAAEALRGGGGPPLRQRRGAPGHGPRGLGVPPLRPGGERRGVQVHGLEARREPRHAPGWRADPHPPQPPARVEPGTVGEGPGRGRWTGRGGRFPTARRPGKDRAGLLGEPPGAEGHPPVPQVRLGREGRRGRLPLLRQAARWPGGHGFRVPRGAAGHDSRGGHLLRGRDAREREGRARHRGDRRHEQLRRRGLEQRDRSEARGERRGDRGLRPHRFLVLRWRRRQRLGRRLGRGAREAPLPLSPEADRPLRQPRLGGSGAARIAGCFAVLELPDRKADGNRLDRGDLHGSTIGPAVRSVASSGSGFSRCSSESTKRPSFLHNLPSSQISPPP
jgi:hypothetical protein